MLSDVPQAALAMGTVLAVWLLLWLLTVGLGRGVLLAAVGRQGLQGTTWDVAACAGYAFLIAVLTVAHLAVPIDGRVLMGVSLLALGGWLATYRTMASATEKPRPMSWGGRLALAAGALWLANRAIGPCASYDAANYQLSLVQWYHLHPVVPGLANLSPLFGVNLSSLLFNALLESGPGWQRSSHFANGFLLLLLARVLVRRLASALAKDNPNWSPSAAAATVLLFPLVWQASAHGGLWVTSPATDLPLFVVSGVSLVLGLETISARPAASPGAYESHLFAALAMTSVLPALKATALFFGVASFCLWAWIALRSPETHERARRTVTAASALALVLAIAWLTRGVILTGYLVFPSPWLAFDVDWRLPREYGDGMYWWTHAYSRTPGDPGRMLTDNHGLAWLPYWWTVEGRSALSEMLVPLGIAAAGAALCLRSRIGRLEMPAGLLLVPAAIALPIWFWTTPLVRYGQFLFWCLAATVVAIAADRFRHLPGRLGRRLLIAAVIGSTTGPLVVQAHYASRDGESRHTIVRDVLWTPAGPDNGFHPSFQAPVRAETRCNGSLVVHVPVVDITQSEGQPWEPTLPWQAPLPAATFPLPEVCARRDGSVRSGFFIPQAAGDWSTRHAAEVQQVRRRSGLEDALLAIHFGVRPELIAKSLSTPQP